jgi:phosphopantetheinyl transferase (holo-ACP synthase)
MVGNDVVDLNDRDADPGSLNPRFDARVFSAEELETLRVSARPVQLRWRLWAAKEAAYKAVSKAHPEIVFSPLRFRVELGRPFGKTEVETGVVSCSAGRCQVSVAESDAAVHAVARFDPPCRREASEAPTLHRGQLRVAPARTVCEDPHAPSRVVRAFSRVRLAEILGVDADELEIRRRGRIPELWIGGVRAEADLSLSHHGTVVAFACELPTRGRPVATAAKPRKLI